MVSHSDGALSLSAPVTLTPLCLLQSVFKKSFSFLTFVSLGSIRRLQVNDSTELLQQVLVLQAVADWWPFVWPLCLLALLGLVVKQIWMKHLWRSNSSDDKKKR